MSVIPCIIRLEIHLTYRCNLRCAHCHNLVGAAPSNEDMPLDCLDKMLADSVALQWPWEWLVLHGGEPCLHPEIEAVYQKLADYKAHHRPSVTLILTTNGYGSHIPAALDLAQRYGIYVSNSQKTGAALVPGHTAVLSSPQDCGEDWQMGCYQSSQCGIAYTPRGFYECSPAGAAWRVLGYEPLCTELKDVSAERLAEGFKLHCRHCGYARYTDRNFEHNPEAPISPTWAKALARYRPQ